MPAFHLTFATDGRLPLFPSQAPRLAALHAIGRVAGDKVLLFCLVDDHAHIALDIDPGRVGVMSRSLLLALRPLAEHVEPAHVRPVESRSHLEWLVGYMLRQPIKHGMPGHPALWSGSCICDLVGARVVPGLEPIPRLMAVLPRFRLREAFAHAGLPKAELFPLDDDGIRDLGAVPLARAAAFVTASTVPLVGKAAPVAAARAATCQLARQAGIATRDVTRVLAITPQAVGRLARKAVDPRLPRAVRLRLALELATQP